MEHHRTLEIDTISAKDLNNVNLITKMDVYVVVSISGEKTNQTAKTPVDHDGDNNPSWNFTTKFTVDENAASRLTLVFKLRCQRALGDKDIGEVHVPIRELLESPINNNGAKQFVSYQVRKPSGKPKGQLSFSYQFGDKIAAGKINTTEPVTAAYPAVTPGPMTGSGYGSSSVYPPAPPVHCGAVESGPYPPPPPGYGYGGPGPTPPPFTGYPQGGPAVAPPPPYGGYYGYPPPPPPTHYGGYPPHPAAAQYGGYPPPPAPAGYGYPNQSGYGYPPVQQQQQKKNKFGLGLGAGLLGGAVGGMIIGDAISDGSGFDGGFDF